MPHLKIGRSPENDIIINDNLVSAQHAVIWTDGQGRCFLEDKGSTNGSFVNRKKIKVNTPILLKFKDEIIIGRQNLDWKSYLVPKQESNTVQNLDKTQTAIKTYSPEAQQKRNDDNVLWIVIWGLIGLSILLLILAYIFY